MQSWKKAGEFVYYYICSQIGKKKLKGDSQSATSEYLW